MYIIILVYIYEISQQNCIAERSSIIKSCIKLVYKINKCIESYHGLSLEKNLNCMSLLNLTTLSIVLNSNVGIYCYIIILLYLLQIIKHLEYFFSNIIKPLKHEPMT